VEQRLGHRIEHLRVELEGVAVEHQLGLLALAIRRHPNGAVQAGGERAQRDHPHAHDAFLDVVGQPALPVEERVEVTEQVLELGADRERVAGRFRHLARQPVELGVAVELEVVEAGAAAGPGRHRQRSRGGDAASLGAHRRIDRTAEQGRGLVFRFDLA
jgi:hypothetical protein